MMKNILVVFWMLQSLASMGLAASLNVPYFQQKDNVFEPSATCGNTSGSMLISYHLGSKVTPDSIYKSFGKSRGQSPEGLAYIYKAFGLYSYATRQGTRAEIKAHLQKGRPVVVHGYFTPNGHIITIIGFTETGWIVNDPAGEWKKCAYCGYYPNSLGKGLNYNYSYVNNNVLSYDGDIWYSVASTSPL